MTGDHDHRMDEDRIGDLGDRFVLLRLDHMGMHTLKIPGVVEGAVKILFGP
jgi:hypothetical protein